MKKYKFELNQYDFDIFFPQHLVKTKIEILEILMEATRHMLVENSKNIKASSKFSSGAIILVVDKMSRLFFCKKDKSYSIIFPFTVSESEDKLDFTFQENGIEIEVDHELISNVISVIKNETFHSNYSIDFANDIDEMESNYNENFWILLRSLLLMEDGYVRYDIDPIGYEEAKRKGKEHTHPLHHIDIFYSSNVTFKLGLEKEINEDELVDCINIKTECKYLKKII